MYRSQKTHGISDEAVWRVCPERAGSSSESSDFDSAADPRDKSEVPVPDSEYQETTIKEE